MKFDRATVIAAAEYYIQHPAETLPKWFNSCVNMQGIPTKDNKWIITYFLENVFELAPSQHWKEISGRRVLVEVDKNTKEERLYIHWQGGTLIEFFKIAINKSDESSEILLDKDISQIDETTIENRSKPNKSES
ncbi:hypothetical protein [Massilia rubra]|uniref:Polyketide cyclase n=1 Tax=Massilia rubra TaxID=2607910 RepID=A0ABX0LN20_9BURK|nr:hypothetical protein [Massilia rubra]NHZ36238.1 hypothetical protein [Massilia rubra]